MRRLLIFIALVTACSLCRAQTTDAKQGARELAQGLSNFDAEEVVRLTHPIAINMLGGRARALKSVHGTLDGMKEDPRLTSTFKLGPPSATTQVGSHLLQFFPYMMRVLADGQAFYTGYAYFIALSEDSGHSWKFIDGAKINKENIKMLIPDYKGVPAIPSQLSDASYK